MDLEPCAVDAAAPFGLLIRLAKDWEFVETESSARNFVLCAPRDELDLDGFAPDVRNDEYDCALPTAARPFAPFTAPSLALVLVRDTARRGSSEGCGPFCSNFFFMSFTLARAVEAGISTPGMSASLSYFDTYRCNRLPANLIQAQRDLFGAHTYERIDRPGSFHTEWTKLAREGK